MSENTPAPESKVEAAKRAGRHLRGSISQTLRSDAVHFGSDDLQLLKFHGTYQQDNRDLRKQRRAAGQDKAYQFMLRTVLPAGILSAEQYLVLDDLADRYANGSLRITTRQGFQFHGLLKGDLKSTIANLNQRLLTTLGACGDVQRNVMACPAPFEDQAHRQVQRTAGKISLALRPRSRAYHEIWLDGEKTQISAQPEEPFYGETYLPRKLKTGIALDFDNCVDIFAYDVGLVAITQDGRVQGYNLLVGGGMGMTHNKPQTMARLADVAGFIQAQDAVEAVRTVAEIFRDHGNRADRKQARLKYLLERWGMERFRREFQVRTSIPLEPPEPMATLPVDDHLGLHPHGDGENWFLGVHIPTGRIVDRPGRAAKTALRTLVKRYGAGVRLTPQQNLLLTHLSRDAALEAEDLLARSGLARLEEVSGVRRYAMACPALPTCGLALGESERLLPKVVDEVEAELRSLGLGQEPVSLRMTGCPNGCARPYNADIAFVARSPKTYHVYVGGRLAGDRMADLYAADVSPGEFLETLRPLLILWAQERQADEGLGDFYQRLRGVATHRRKLTGKEQPSVDESLVEIAL